LIANDRDSYQDLSAAARRRMADYASRSVATAALRRALDRLHEPEGEALAQAS
jgi:hypothetical protein